MAEKKKLSDSLRPASFRGVPFQVESTELGAGRRTQLHEYPQRDKPYVEDLGRATRDLSFYGFVVGEDYVDQANSLLSALEEAGPGTLVHPWFGTLQVSLKEPARVSFDAALGVARFSMAFIESGELAEPELIAEATRLSLAAGADFVKTSTGKTPVSATPEAARVMLREIAASGMASAGFKASGGIRSVADAQGYLQLAADVLGAEALQARRFRFGASGLLKDIESVLSGQASQAVTSVY